VEIFDIFGPRTVTPCTDWLEILLGQANPHAPRLCQISRESVQRVTRVTPVGQNVDFWPVSKFNTGTLPLRGNPAGKNHSPGRQMFSSWKMADHTLCLKKVGHFIFTVTSANVDQYS